MSQLRVSDIVRAKNDIVISGSGPGNEGFTIRKDTLGIVERNSTDPTLIQVAWEDGKKGTTSLRTPREAIAAIA